MINISLFDNYIVLDSKMIGVLELTPIDLYLESDQEQKLFNENVQRVINQIRDYEIQFLVKVSNMKLEELKPHFALLRKYIARLELKVGETRRTNVEKYIQGLSNLLSISFVPSKKIYLCLSIPINGINNKERYVLSKNLLENRIERIKVMFSKCQIRLSTLEIEQVKLLLKDNFRI